MAEEIPFTIESFYKFVKEKKVMEAQCSKCGQLILPPRPMCPKCLSKDLEWKESPKQGKLLTYTVIHVSPQQFQSLAPYAVGIVELEIGAHLAGMIKGIALDQIKVGMDLTIDFEDALTASAWQQWPRYYFRR
ncbi:MAG TPA: Zn-ribbon domain-containing OB-fold protein [Candidatus Bathyarchaeia archaeon]|nr:Zn-ribbon domain-containing OB-fold protein [Candidatus Bathyarchaeia archaeon]